MIVELYFQQIRWFFFLGGGSKFLWKMFTSFLLEKFLNDPSYHFSIISGFFLIPSRVSGGGYKIGTFCVCVCLFVCQHSHG